MDGDFQFERINFRRRLDCAMNGSRVVFGRACQMRERERKIRDQFKKKKLGKKAIKVKQEIHKWTP